MQLLVLFGLPTCEMVNLLLFFIEKNYYRLNVIFDSNVIIHLKDNIDIICINCTIFNVSKHFILK